MTTRRRVDAEVDANVDAPVASRGRLHCVTQADDRPLLQLLRSDLTSGHNDQKLKTAEAVAYLRGRLYENRKRQGERSDLTSPHCEEKSTAAEQLAEEHRVSRATIERDAAFTHLGRNPACRGGGSGRQ